MQVPVYMMVGCPASGKSTEAARIAERIGADVYNADKIREELYGDASIQGDPKKVFSLLYNRAKDDIAIGRPVVLDNTNLTVKDRKRAMDALRTPDTKFRAVVMTTPEDVCRTRNKNRSRVVPEYVIDRMVKKYQAPTLEEGFDRIAYR